MMAIGILLATAAVLRASVEDATPETSLPPASPLITAEGPTAVGTLLARPGAPLQAWALGGIRDQGRFAAAPVSAARISADPRSAARLSLDRVRVIPCSDHSGTLGSDRARICLAAHASIPMAATVDLGAAGVGTETVGAGAATTVSAGAATVGIEAIGLVTTTTVGATTVGAATFLEQALAGAGALASDGRTGAATGDRAGLTDGTPGGTTPIGTRPGRRTTTTRIILTSDTTLRRPTLRMLCLTTTPRRAT
jgi:hypothetical protein